MVWEYSDDFLVECSIIKWLTLALSPAILCKSLNGTGRGKMQKRHWKEGQPVRLCVVETRSYCYTLPKACSERM
jgi:hypothetical protein